ncbi:hypothetical protein ABZ464_04075 [Streptomyces sp. NPDC005820]|uniref:hypothetical protein n=1 Tax=Streptomyces sp. NPDC005820 TaxID=3157069 RepID=UPI0033D45071
MTGVYFSAQRGTVSDVEVMAVLCDVDQDDSATGQSCELLDIRNHPRALGGNHHLCGVLANLDVGLSALQLGRQPSQESLGDSEVTPSLVGLRMSACGH